MNINANCKSSRDLKNKEGAVPTACYLPERRLLLKRDPATASGTAAELSHMPFAAHGDPAKELCEKYADKGADAVDADIFHGWTASIYKALVIFIPCGKKDAGSSCHQYKKDPSQPINI